MRRHFTEWKAEMQERVPSARIDEVRQNGGLVGAFAWEGVRHLGSWPDYLIPGYQILQPLKDDYA